jgi:hypothetical protein
MAEPAPEDKILSYATPDRRKSPVLFAIILGVILSLPILGFLGYAYCAKPIMPAGTRTQTSTSVTRATATSPAIITKTTITTTSAGTTTTVTTAPYAGEFDNPPEN